MTQALPKTRLTPFIAGALAAASTGFSCVTSGDGGPGSGDTPSESSSSSTLGDSETTESTSGSVGSSTSSESGSTASSLCDGTQDVRLVQTVYAELPVDDTRNPAQAVMWENGKSYFYVTGTCEFRVLTGEQHLLAADLVGVLSPEDAEELAADLRYEEWPSYYDTMPGFRAMSANPALIDENGAFLVGGSCFAGALDPNDCPDPFPSVASGIDEWRDRLRTLAAPADGPMRVAAVLEEPPGVVADGIEWAPWPLARPIADFVLDAEAPIEAGHGETLTDAEEIEAMRSFRESFVAQFGPEDTIRGIYVIDDGMHYLVYARDAAPIEDENGLVPWLHHFGPGE